MKYMYQIYVIVFFEEKLIISEAHCSRNNSPNLSRRIQYTNLIMYDMAQSASHKQQTFLGEANLGLPSQVVIEETIKVGSQSE